MLNKSILFILFFTFEFTINVIPNNSKSSNETFAEKIIETLQNEWYVQNWECSAGNTNPWQLKNIWNAYNLADALIDFTAITGKQTYISVIEKFMDNQCAFEDSKYAGYDDAQWTAIALIKIYKLTSKKEYFNKAVDIWNYIIYNSWDTLHCGGGLWWNIERTYKNAITNELFLMLSTMLFIETKEKVYLDWAIKEWEWFKSKKLIADEDDNNHVKNLINDGLNKSCQNNGRTIWSYNQGVILGGLTNLYLITGNIEFIKIAVGIADKTINEFNHKGIMIEREMLVNPEYILNTDQQQFKGIFIRYLSYLIKHLPEDFKNEKEKFTEFVMRNADWIINTSQNYKINAYWIAPTGTQTKEVFNPISQTSGLDLINASIILQKR